MIDVEKENEMRTAIFLGLIYVGDCVGKPEAINESTTAFFGIVLGIMMVMDIVDCFRG